MYVFHIYFTRCSISISSQKFRRERKEWKKKSIVSIGRREQYFKRWFRSRKKMNWTRSQTFSFELLLWKFKQWLFQTMLWRKSERKIREKITSKCAVAQYIYLYIYLALRGEAVIFVWNGSEKWRENYRQNVIRQTNSNNKNAKTVSEQWIQKKAKVKILLRQRMKYQPLIDWTIRLHSPYTHSCSIDAYSYSRYVLSFHSNTHSNIHTMIIAISAHSQMTLDQRPEHIHYDTALSRC